MKTVHPAADRFYSNQGNRELLDLVAGVRPGWALDCGCGAGDNARILASRGWRVTGITLSKQEASAAEKFCDRIFITDLEAGLPHLSRRYDLVILSHVLEHLLQPSCLLSRLPFALSHSGIVAVALPNVLSIHQRFQFLMGRFDYTTAGTMDETHVRFYTFKTGRELLNKNGFDVQHASVSGHLPLAAFRSLLPDRLTHQADRLICRCLPGLFGCQLMYLARPQAIQYD
jgi:2-polyprenyl-3-methyl-5-hydroxy-6-metoxy-1,4-benzoquinol methylase